MNKEQLKELRKSQITGNSKYKKDKVTKGLLKYYYDLLGGNEKGLYGMRNDLTGKIDYVGESIDMPFRMWEHYHEIKVAERAGGISSSFYRHCIDGSYLTVENALNNLELARNSYTPECLWSQSEDTPLGNAERLYKEIELIQKYLPSLNGSRLDLSMYRKDSRAIRMKNDNGEQLQNLNGRYNF